VLGCSEGTSEVSIGFGVSPVFERALPIYKAPKP
jgi:hypothetical protein